MNEGVMRLVILLSVVSVLLLIGMIIFGFWMFDFALVRKEQMDFDAGDDLLPHMDVIRFRSREAQNKIMNMPHEDVYIKSYDDLLLHATFVMGNAGLQQYRQSQRRAVEQPFAQVQVRGYAEAGI